jgi:hypothetical protein
VTRQTKWWSGFFVCSLLVSAAYSQLRDAVEVAITPQAERFLKTLSSEQRALAVMPMDAPQRTDWHFIPKPQRKGLQLRDMQEAQREAALALLRASLSELGYSKAQRIMTMENLLKELEKEKANAPLRDPLRYFFTLFGDPSAESRWGLSIEGHHLSLNFVVDHGKIVSSTPQALASNPANVKVSTVDVVPVGTQILNREEELGFKLLSSLDETQKGLAIVADKAPADVRAAGAPHPPKDPPVGIPVTKLTETQVTMLRALIQEYANAMPTEVAQQRIADLENAGIEKAHFAWLGATKPGIGHYYRVQGPTFVIEFCNVQADAAGNPANHIHTLWRDMRGDFGLPIE